MLLIPAVIVFLIVFGLLTYWVFGLLEALEQKLQCEQKPQCTQVQKLQCEQKPQCTQVQKLQCTQVQKPQCTQVLGGIANKQCQLPPGHSGPHITEWQGQTYWFETGTRIELLDRYKR